jgi:hypothetical protein
MQKGFVEALSALISIVVRVAVLTVTVFTVAGASASTHVSDGSMPTATPTASKPAYVSPSVY